MLLAQEGGRAFRAGDADRQLLPEAPELVVPAAGDLTYVRSRQVRVLFPYQCAHQSFVDLEVVHRLTQSSTATPPRRDSVVAACRRMGDLAVMAYYFGSWLNFEVDQK